MINPAGLLEIAENEINIFEDYDANLFSSLMINTNTNNNRSDAELQANLNNFLTNSCDFKRVFDTNSMILISTESTLYLQHDKSNLELILDRVECPGDPEQMLTAIDDQIDYFIKKFNEFFDYATKTYKEYRYNKDKQPNYPVNF